MIRDILSVYLEKKPRSETKGLCDSRQEHPQMMAGEGHEWGT